MPHLVDLALPPARWRDPIAVAAAVALVAAGAQVEIPLAWSPVPISGQTFAVALVGAALGPARGAVALIAYLLVGLGAPVYAGGAYGAEVWAGPTVGYLLGFVGSAAIVGALAGRGALRRWWLAWLAFEAGSLCVFTAGTVGLMARLELGLIPALQVGVLPFLPGDLLKSAVGAGLASAAWRRLAGESTR